MFHFQDCLKLIAPSRLEIDMKNSTKRAQLKRIMEMLKDAKDFYNIDASTFKRFIKLLDGIENGQLPSVAGLEILISDFTEENPTDSADIFLKKKKILLFCELLKISSSGVKIQDFVKLTPGQKKFAGKAITDALGQGSICFVAQFIADCQVSKNSRAHEF